jgi:hypothetical protein
VPLTLAACARIGLVHVVSFRGDFDSKYIGRALDAARAAGDPWAEAYALNFQAMFEAEKGEFGQYSALTREARDGALRSSSPLAWQPLALAIRLIGYDALHAGRLDEAGQQFEEVIALLRKHGDVGRWASC